MDIDLPEPIAGYFAADQGKHANAIARHFAGNAVVKDEGHIYEGREAIRRWKAASSAKFNYRVEPLAIADRAGLTVVTARLTGDFPGSPVQLRYRFALQDGEIAGLEIAP